MAFDYKKEYKEAKQMLYGIAYTIKMSTYEEGLCVQCMHYGPYDDEPETVELMKEYAGQNGFSIDITPERYHHEIYLSDPRKTAPEKLKTVIRYPIRKI